MEKPKLTVTLKINPNTILNFAKDHRGNLWPLKELSPENLEMFAEAYKQAIIKKHSK